MEIKLFGKSLFEIKKNNPFFLEGNRRAKESKFLLDFYAFGNQVGALNSLNEALEMVSTSVKDPLKNPKEKKKEEPSNVELTPKGVYELKMLNDLTFKLNTDSDYIDQQIAAFKDKMSLITSEEYDMRRGVEEIGSIVMRFENRKKYPEVHEFFEQFAYTTTAKIGQLVETHSYLKLGQVAQFLADMPTEAVNLMKDYNKHSKEVCDKQAVFYIIANKRDFEKNNTRRDPILLAQSPFGHFWQIIGAWDEEMLIVDQL